MVINPDILPVRLILFQSLKTRTFRGQTSLTLKYRWLRSKIKGSIACANPVLIVGRRASRQGRIPLLPLNFHLDPPPGSGSLLVGFRARKMFTEEVIYLPSNPVVFLPMTANQVVRSLFSLAAKGVCLETQAASSSRFLNSSSCSAGIMTEVNRKPSPRPDAENGRANFP